MDERAFFEGVASYRLLAKKEVGQNFLVDAKTASFIVDALDIQPEEKILEIGCGAGSLTFFLAQSKGNVEAIDIDEAMLLKTGKDFQNRPNLEVKYGNAAKWDYAPYDKVIGNLPYYITSLLIERALLTGTNAKAMVFMVQKEAGDRLLAKVGTKDYGPLPILIALLSNAKKSFVVRRGCFAPAPHVDSVVLRFEMKPERDPDIEKAYKICNALFLQRRKTLLNNLKNMIHDGEKARRILSDLSLSENLRPEQVPPETYLALAKML